MKTTELKAILDDSSISKEVTVSVLGYGSSYHSIKRVSFFNLSGLKNKLRGLRLLGTIDDVVLDGYDLNLFLK